MNFEVLKRSHLKRNIIIGIVVVLMLSAVVLTFTRAKYRVTESVPLVSGTINFSPYDFNVVAMYLNQDGAMPAGQTKNVPRFGFDLDTEQSICYVDGEQDNNITIEYFEETIEKDAYVDFHEIKTSGTKCNLYFDLQEDTENPSLEVATSSGDTSITIQVTAVDNIGVYYYYYKLDNGEEIQSEEGYYTFEGLEEDSVHTITVRVEDAAGNEASTSKEVTVGINAGRYILASANAPIKETTDWIGGTTYYYDGKPNNWVQFGGFYWRIIRINGDSSVRIIYQGASANETGISTQIMTSDFNNSANNNMYVGYMYQSGVLHGLQQSSTIKNVLDSWYQSNLETNYGQYIDGNAGFCGDRRISSGSGIDTTTTAYQADTRKINNSPSLSCEASDIYTTKGSSSGNKSLTKPIGLISSDEAILGGVLNGGNSGTSYLYTTEEYWTMSPYGYNAMYGRAYVFYVSSTGALSPDWGGVDDSLGVRPVINLRSDIQLTGTGTSTDPFRLSS